MDNNDNKEYTERRGSLIILTITILIIIVIIIVSLLVVFLVQEHAKVVLICLLGLLLLVGVVAFVFLELQRRDAQRKRDRGADQLVREMIYEQTRNQRVEPDVSISSSYYGPGNSTATWALTKPWRYSQGSTIPARSN